MISLDMQSTVNQALKQVNSLKRELKDKAIVRALNDTISKENTQASKEVKAQGYNLPVAQIKKGIHISRANKNHLQAVMRALPKSINLKYFGAKKIGKAGMNRDAQGRISYKASKQSGVRVKVKGSSTILRHAFIGKGGWVLERTTSGKGRHYGIMTMRGGFQVDGGQVKMVSGVPVSKMIQNDIVWNELVKVAKDHFPKRLQHHLKRFTK